MVGNFWLDYSGGDTDGDGIGETPYEISTDVFDYYPLTYVIDYSTSRSGGGSHQDIIGPYPNDESSEYTPNNEADVPEKKIIL